VKISDSEVPNIIDEIPVLTVAAAKAEGLTEIIGVKELRVKETDRIASMIDNLTKAGADIYAREDNLYINGRGGRFKSGEFISYGDHRTAMSMAVAARLADGESIIRDTDCVKTSFPVFFELLDHVGR